MSTGIIKLNPERFNQIIEEFSSIGGKVPVALSRAINRAADAGRAEVVRKVRDNYTASATKIRKTMRVTKSKPNSLQAVIQSRGESLSLKEFKVSPGTPNPRHRNPISVEVRRGSRKTLDSAFVQRVGATVSVFERSGKARLPIEKKFGPSVPVMMNNENVVSAVMQRAEEQLESRIGHELNRILGVR